MTESINASAAFPRVRVPGLTYLLWALLFSFFFFGDVSARIVHSLADGGALGRRQTVAAGECRFQIDGNYTSKGTLVRVGPDFAGPGMFTGGTTVDSGIKNNNRTINGTSAAEAHYDAFFDGLKKQTGRDFPAMSSIRVYFEFATTPKGLEINWTPYRWCVNGTISNCAGTIGTSNATSFVEACGPLFVSDDDGNGGNTDPASTKLIQGEIVPYHGLT